MRGPERMEIATSHGEQMLELLNINTQFTESTKDLSETIATLTRELYGKMCSTYTGRPS